MSEALPSFQFFARRMDGGPVVAITLNMDLRAQLSPAARPLACRVSVNLLKPSSDGVINDPKEIERLGELGNGLTDHLTGGTSLGFAGMYTSAGVRTWLFYCPTPESTLFGGPTSEPIVAKVESAFAGQSDYVPVTQVDLDPDWSAYASLYPTAAEQDELRFQQALKVDRARAQAMSTATAQMLMRQGDDLTQPRDIDFGLYFPTADARSTFAELAKANGFTVREPTAAGDAAVAATPFPVTVIRREAVLPTRMAQIENWLIDKARRAGGTYDGWGCFAAVPRKPG
jgi:hypothetical protein